MSTFVAHHTHPLIAAAVPSSSLHPGTPSPSKEHLHALLLSLEAPISRTQVQEAIESLKSNESSLVAVLDDEHAALKRAVLARLSVALYADTLQIHLDEATEAETEAEWWAEIERSRSNVAWFLLQSGSTRPPARRRAHDLNNPPLAESASAPSAFTPSSLRRLFPNSSTLRPNALLTSLFPNLRPGPQLSVSSAWLTSKSALLFPLDLVRDECRANRLALRRIRDARAEILGQLLHKRDEVERAISQADSTELLRFVRSLDQLAGPGVSAPPSPRPPNTASLLTALSTVSDETLIVHAAQHAQDMGSVRRPSDLTLLWPRLVLLPPLGLFAVGFAYRSRESLLGMARDARATVYGFWNGWVLEPLADIVRTVRAGGDEGLIVSAEGVDADIRSLERMTLALAREKLNYTGEQLQGLSAQIRKGDLTPVLEIYEQDIKSPLRSAVGGTLLRSVFIQVQKAKVDIDQALAGIDKLLKSQELTFAFVGVAPALAIVYIAGDWVLRLWTGSRGRRGGRKARLSAWTAMRRIERLLITQPRSHHPVGLKESADALPPLTAGLMLLSVAHLRRYAEAAFPRGSRIREGFLEDVADLEDAALGRSEKMRVVDRMWRCWAGPLGWAVAGGDGQASS